MSIRRRNIATRKSAVEKEEAILIFEDDTHYLDIMAATLAPFEGRFTLLQAQTLEEARRLIWGRRVVVFLIDMQLPDGTGLDFFQSVRASHLGARTNIVTGTSLIADDKFTERFGIDRLIRKPFRLAELREAVSDLVRRADEGSSEEVSAEEGEAGDETGGQFAGVLKKLSITDIIQLKCISQASTVISLQSDIGERGMIYILKGQIAHAQTGDLQGQAALERIVMWDSGKVAELLPGGGIPRTIQGPWDVLLMEALRKRDEANHNASETSG